MNTKKNYFLYAIGLFISLFGSNVYTFAIGLYVLNLTGNAMSFANTLIFGMLPVIIFSPLSGVLADRYNKKKLIVATDFLNGCLFLLMFYISSIGQLSLPVIYSMTFIVNTVTTLFDSSMSASKVLIFDKDNIGSINATTQVIRSTAVIIAPMVGGLVFGFIDISLYILINGLSFIFSSTLECFIDFPPHIKSETHASSLKSNFQSGMTYMKDKKSLHPYILYFVMLNFVIGLSLNVPFPYIINTVLKRPAALLGTIESIFPIGLLVGGLLVSRLTDRFSYDAILKGINYALIVLLALVALPGLIDGSLLSNRFLLIYYGAINFLFGLGISFVDVPIITILHQQIEPSFQGRVLSLVMSVVKVIYPVGLALSGLLLHQLNPFALPLIGGILALAFALYFRKGIQQTKNTNYTATNFSNPSAPIK